MTDPKPFVSTTASSADEDDVTGLRPPSRVSKLVQSSSVETTSKASTRKEKPSSEAQQADETQSSADEPEAVSTSKETETNPPNRKKLILILVAAVIVIVAVVTGATVGANLRGSSNEQAEATDPVSENKPTAAPNPSPTDSLAARAAADAAQIILATAQDQYDNFRGQYDLDPSNFNLNRLQQAQLNLDSARNSYNELDAIATQTEAIYLERANI
jgi:hypothetical protein